MLHPRYNPGEGAGSDVTTVTIRELYLLMGREVEEVDSVGAGHILGIGGLGEHVLKCCTLSSTLACPALRSAHFASSPIVHVAIEPVHLSDTPLLVKGMRLLNQADPCVEVTIQESGQHVLSTAGEVHLQRCLDDLRQTFARVELSVSEPIVPFRETVIETPKMDMVNEAITSLNEVKKARVTNALLSRAEGEELVDNSDGVVTVTTANKACLLKIKATPLPVSVVEILLRNSQLLKLLLATGNDSQLSKDVKVQLAELKISLEECFSVAEGNWVGVVDNIMAFGPRGVGPNILVNKVIGYARPSLWKRLDDTVGVADKVVREYDNSVLSGFQLSTLAGPLCEEPLQGVCYSLLDWTPGEGADDEVGGAGGEVNKGGVYGPFSGQLISAMKDGCRKALLIQPTRLMAAMYSCSILVGHMILMIFISHFHLLPRQRLVSWVKFTA